MAGRASNDGTLGSPHTRAARISSPRAHISTHTSGGDVRELTIHFYFGNCATNLASTLPRLKTVLLYEINNVYKFIKFKYESFVLLNEMYAKENGWNFVVGIGIKSLNFRLVAEYTLPEMRITLPLDLPAKACLFWNTFYN